MNIGSIHREFALVLGLLCLLVIAPFACRAQPPAAEQVVSETRVAEVEAQTAEIARRVSMTPFERFDPTKVLPPPLTGIEVEQALGRMDMEFRSSAAYRRLVEQKDQALAEMLVAHSDKPDLQLVGVVAAHNIDPGKMLECSMRALLMSDRPLDTTLLIVCNVVHAERDQRRLLECCARQIIRTNARSDNLVQLFGLGVLPQPENLARWYVEGGSGQLSPSAQGIMAWVLMSVFEGVGEWREQVRGIIDKWDGADRWQRAVSITFGSEERRTTKAICNVLQDVNQKDSESGMYRRMVEELIRRQSRTLRTRIKECEGLVAPWIIEQVNKW